ncbi:MAG: helix-turn-helix transcriptional regulator [Armatimonadetes bacterium]|nr:helix-turn-helix transcriptional regulator [Armatimonadota bacterium]
MKQFFMYLDEMPKIGQLSCFRPSSDVLEWIQPPSWYLLALVVHRGRLVVSGESHEFEPGSVILFEPSSRCRIEVLGDQEVTTHFWMNFLPQRVGTHLLALPRVVQLGAEASFWEQLFRQGLNTLPFSHSQFYSAGWNLLWHISSNAAEIKKNQYVRVAEEYILRNLSSPISVAGVAESIQISHNHLIRIFRQELGITPSEFIRTKRMQEAFNLLVTTNGSIKEVGQKVGYPDPKHFHRVVLATFGTGPAEVRRNRSRADVYS